jgi:starvation-inducible outer membrane lipoprotein
MQDTRKVVFLTVTALAALLSGCGGAPSRLQNRNGDFINHIASATQRASTAAAAGPIAMNAASAAMGRPVASSVAPS